MKKHNRTAGFTIVELLIATAVFSVVLLTISAAIIQIGRLYYKGITSARTQEAARAVMDDIAQVIQFETGRVALGLVGPNGSQAICVATKHYSYKLGQQQAQNGANFQHALVRKDVPAGCLTTAAQDLSSSTPPIEGQEMLGEKMRLANLQVERQGLSDAYMIKVRVAYGDAELLCDPDNAVPTNAANCKSTLTMTEGQIANTRKLSCKNIRTGTQFCAVSELSTIVKRRLSDE